MSNPQIPQTPADPDQIVEVHDYRGSRNRRVIEYRTVSGDCPPEFHGYIMVNVHNTSQRFPVEFPFPSEVATVQEAFMRFDEFAAKAVEEAQQKMNNDMRRIIIPNMERFRR